VSPLSGLPTRQAFGAGNSECEPVQSEKGAAARLNMGLNQEAAGPRFNQREAV